MSESRCIYCGDKVGIFEAFCVGKDCEEKYKARKESDKRFKEGASE